MLGVTKRLFKYDYLSPLDIETCKERLTADYRMLLVDKGQYILESAVSWHTGIYPHKTGGLEITSHWGRFWFSYRIIFEESDKGTILHCTHNPFTFNALLLPTAFATFLFLGLLIGLFEILLTEKTSSPDSAIVIILGIFFVVALCVPLEIFARKAVHRLVYQLAQGEPVR